MAIKERRERRPVGDRVRIALAVAALLAGAALIAYPYVSDYLHRSAQVSVVQSHESAVAGESEESLQDEMRASLSYNERLLASRTVITDPFDPENAPVSPEEYESRCNMEGDGVMGSLVIPKIGVTVPLYHGTSEEVLRKGAGHLDATSLPVGGPSSHAAFAGHNGLPSVRIFDDLQQLAVGDYFVIRILGEDHAYRVTGTETVLPDETESLRVQEGRDLVTLITCTPYGVNTHRLLVHAERCEVPEQWYARDAQESDSVRVGASQVLLPFSIAGAALAVGAIGARALALHRRRLRKRRFGAQAQVDAMRARRGYGASRRPGPPASRGPGRRRG